MAGGPNFNLLIPLFQNPAYDPTKMGGIPEVQTTGSAVSQGIGGILSKGMGMAKGAMGGGGGGGGRATGGPMKGRKPYMMGECPRCRAIGGPVNEEGSYLVGENGDEEMFSGLGSMMGGAGCSSCRSLGGPMMAASPYGRDEGFEVEDNAGLNCSRPPVPSGAIGGTGMDSNGNPIDYSFAMNGRRKGGSIKAGKKYLTGEDDEYSGNGDINYDNYDTENEADVERKIRDLKQTIDVNYYIGILKEKGYSDQEAMDYLDEALATKSSVDGEEYINNYLQTAKPKGGGSSRSQKGSSRSQGFMNSQGSGGMPGGMAGVAQSQCLHCGSAKGVQNVGKVGSNNPMGRGGSSSPRGMSNGGGRSSGGSSGINFDQMKDMSNPKYAQVLAQQKNDWRGVLNNEWQQSGMDPNAFRQGLLDREKMAGWDPSGSDMDEVTRAAFDNPGSFFGQQSDSTNPDLEGALKRGGKAAKGKSYLTGEPGMDPNSIGGGSSFFGDANNYQEQGNANQEWLDYILSSRYGNLEEESLGQGQRGKKGKNQGPNPVMKGSRGKSSGINVGKTGCGKCIGSNDVPSTGGTTYVGYTNKPGGISARALGGEMESVNQGSPLDNPNAQAPGPSAAEMESQYLGSIGKDGPQAMASSIMSPQGMMAIESMDDAHCPAMRAVGGPMQPGQPYMTGENNMFSPTPQGTTSQTYQHSFNNLMQQGGEMPQQQSGGMDPKMMQMVQQQFKQQQMGNKAPMGRAMGGEMLGGNNYQTGELFQPGMPSSMPIMNPNPSPSNSNMGGMSGGMMPSFNGNTGRAMGGPIDQDQSYPMGETGNEPRPEMVVPHDGSDPYYVGLNGPEVITPPVDSTVIPNPKTMMEDPEGVARAAQGHDQADQESAEFNSGNSYQQGEDNSTFSSPVGQQGSPGGGLSYSREMDQQQGDHSTASMMGNSGAGMNTPRMQQDIGQQGNDQLKELHSAINDEPLMMYKDLSKQLPQVAPLMAKEAIETRKRLSEGMNLSKASMGDLIGYASKQMNLASMLQGLDENTYMDRLEQITQIDSGAPKKWNPAYVAGNLAMSTPLRKLQFRGAEPSDPNVPNHAASVPSIDQAPGSEMQNPLGNTSGSSYKMVDNPAPLSNMEKYSNPPQDGQDPYVQADIPKGNITSLRGNPPQQGGGNSGQGIGYQMAQGPAGSSGFYSKVNKAEGTGKNPYSSASGPYQFTNGTFGEYLKSTNPGMYKQYASAGSSGQSQMKNEFMRQNPNKAMDWLVNKNSQTLQKSGVPINDATLYGAHFLGSGAISKVWNAPNNAPVSQYLPGSVIAANKSVLQGKTVGEFKGWLNRKMGSSGSQDGNISGVQMAQRSTGSKNARPVNMDLGIGSAGSSQPPASTNMGGYGNIHERNPLSGMTGGNPTSLSALTGGPSENPYIPPQPPGQQQMGGGYTSPGMNQQVPQGSKVVSGPGGSKLYYNAQTGQLQTLNANGGDYNNLMSEEQAVVGQYNQLAKGSANQYNAQVPWVSNRTGVMMGPDGEAIRMPTMDIPSIKGGSSTVPATNFQTGQVQFNPITNQYELHQFDQSGNPVPNNYAAKTAAHLTGMPVVDYGQQQGGMGGPMPGQGGMQSGMSPQGGGMGQQGGMSQGGMGMMPQQQRDPTVPQGVNVPPGHRYMGSHPKTGQSVTSPLDEPPPYYTDQYGWIDPSTDTIDQNLNTQDYQRTYGQAQGITAGGPPSQREVRDSQLHNSGSQLQEALVSKGMTMGQAQQVRAAVQFEGLPLDAAIARVQSQPPSSVSSGNSQFVIGGPNQEQELRNLQTKSVENDLKWHKPPQPLAAEYRQKLTSMMNDPEVQKNTPELIPQIGRILSNDDQMRQHESEYYTRERSFAPSPVKFSKGGNVVTSGSSPGQYPYSNASGGSPQRGYSGTVESTSSSGKTKKPPQPNKDGLIWDDEKQSFIKPKVLEADGVSPAKDNPLAKKEGGKAPSGYRWKEDGNLEPIQGGPATKISSDAAGRFAQYKVASDTLGQVNSMIFKPDGSINREILATGALGTKGVPFTGGREYKTVIHRSIDAAVRAATGATINETEWPKYEAMYMPMLGDTDQQIREKYSALQNFVNSAKASIDSSGFIENQVNDRLGAASMKGPASSAVSSSPSSQYQFSPDQIQAEIQRRKQAGLM